MTAYALTSSANVMSPRQPIMGGVRRHLHKQVTPRAPFQFTTEVSTNIREGVSGPQIVFQTRTGIHGVITYDQNIDDREQVVLVRHTYRFSSTEAIHNVLKQPRMESAMSDEAKLVYAELKRLVRPDANTRTGTHEISLEYRYTLQEILDAGGAIYSPEIDVVLATGERMMESLHPNSHEGVIANFLAKEVPHSRQGFNMGIAINDPNGQIGLKYIFMNGQIFCVVPEKNNHSPPSVMTWCTRASDENSRITGMELPKFFGLAEYEDHCKENPLAIKLYNSYSEARAAMLSDTTSISLQTAEVERLKLQTMIEKLTTELEQERARAERAEQMESTKHSNTMREYDRKEAYEHRSYARKDSSESFKFTTDTIKYVPILVIGLGAAYVAIRTALIAKGE